MAAKLIAEEGSLEGLVLSFEKGEEWIVGRDTDMCQLVVEAPAVSREHLIARKTPEGISIENRSKKNHTLVNDKTIEGAHLLSHGDTVKIGNEVFRFYTEIGTQNHEEQIKKEEEDEIYQEDDPSSALATIDFNVSATGRWMLKVIAGPNNGAEFSMDPGQSYLLGTNTETSDIVFHDGTVSRQHAKLTISSDNKITLQDLKSRNGIFVDDKQIKGKVELASSSIVSLGTTRFVIFDRETDRSTIITPLLPPIVSTVQEEKVKGEKTKGRELVRVVPAARKSSAKGKLAPLIFAAGLLTIIGLATTSLFHTQEVTTPKIDTKTELQKVMSTVPGINYNYNESTKSLLLIGHVLKNVDKARLLYDLQGLNFIHEINDKNLVIDELVLQNTNQIIGKNAQWRGVTLMAPSAGRFVLTGYLQSKAQAEKLSDYMAQNFPYLDLLEKRLFVEEDEIQTIRLLLQEQGFKDVSAAMNSGELTLSGNMLKGKGAQLDKLISTFKKDAAVRSIKNFVIEVEPEKSLVDLSDSYKVTGSSNRGNKTVNVVINGHILSVGDTLDGMTIRSLTQDSIALERDGVRYRIEYNK